MDTQALKKAAHAVYNIKYNLVWGTKYRKPLFVGAEAVKIRAIIKDVCDELKLEIISGVVQKDCIKIVISAPPTISVSVLIGKIKGKSANIMFKESQKIAAALPDGHLWARGYCATTWSEFSEKDVLKYLEIDEDEEVALQN